MIRKKCPDMIERKGPWAVIINPGPFEPLPYEHVCPARLEMTDGRIYYCERWIQPGRTKHARTHEFRQVPDYWEQP